MRILVVEDDHDFGHVVAEHLEARGHEVKLATNAPQALSVMDSFAPEVVLIDIRLPIFDGNNIAEAIRAGRTARPRLIALTSLVDLVDTDLFDAWLAKPTTVAEVSKALSDTFLSTATSTAAGPWQDDAEDTHP